MVIDIDEGWIPITFCCICILVTGMAIGAMIGVEVLSDELAKEVCGKYTKIDNYQTCQEKTYIDHLRLIETVKEL